MTERPLLITPDLVTPVQEDRKTETRRLRDLEIVNEKPDRWTCEGFNGVDKKGRAIAVFHEILDEDMTLGATLSIPCPYGNIGDQLWVRETFMPLTVGYGYKADGMIRTGKNPKTGEYYVPRMKWTPSIHMPRKASRIQLEILNLGIERLHGITEEAAKREGVQRGIFREGPNTMRGEFQLETLCKGSPIGNYLDGFKYVWFTLNGRSSWDINPWVWVITFKRIIS